MFIWLNFATNYFLFKISSRLAISDSKVVIAQCLCWAAYLKPTEANFNYQIKTSFNNSVWELFYSPQRIQYCWPSNLSAFQNYLCHAEGRPLLLFSQTCARLAHWNCSCQQDKCGSGITQLLMTRKWCTVRRLWLPKLLRPDKYNFWITSATFKIAKLGELHYQNKPSKSYAQKKITNI